MYLFWIIAGIIFLNCASTPDKAELKVKSMPEKKPLQIITGALGTPERIEGEIAFLRDTSKIDIEILSFLQEKQELFKLVNPAAELTVARQTTDDLGFVHITMHRRHNSVLVWGDELLFHVNKEGVLYSYSGHYHPSLSDEFMTKSELTPAQAEAAAAKALALSGYAAKETHLAIIFVSDLPRMAYRMIIGKSELAAEQWECFVDAGNGALLDRKSLIRF